MSATSSPATKKQKIAGMNVKKYLEDTRGLAAGSKSVVIVNASESLSKAFETLIEYNILSAPIYDSVEKKYTGVIDVLDIIGFLVTLYGSEEAPGEGVLNIWENFLNKKVFSQIPVKDVSDLSCRNPFCTIPHSANLLDVAKTLVEVHRCCVVDDDGLVQSVITQSSVIALVNAKLKEFQDDIFNKTLGELGLGKDASKVITVNADDKALNAFRLMMKHGVSALAVLGDDGKILSNISARDVKVIRPSEGRYWFDQLFTSVIKLVSKVRDEQLKANHGKTRVPIMCCHTTDKLGEVIGKLAATRVHRLYLEDEDLNLVGVVSLGDILNLISQ